MRWIVQSFYHTGTGETDQTNLFALMGANINRKHSFRIICTYAELQTYELNHLHVSFTELVLENHVKNYFGEKLLFRINLK